MKKILTLMLGLTVVFTLTACTDKIEIPDFNGVEYGDVLSWKLENNYDVKISSEYNDDVLPDTVFYQSIEAGEKVNPDFTLEIKYSRGYDPDGSISVPDFTGKTEQDIIAWLIENDITKYSFTDAFSDSVDEGGFVGFDVTNTEDRTTTLRKDTYDFYFSRGPVEIETLQLDNPDAIRGVNLGGWFVLEGWMTPDLFEGVDGSDETALLEQRDDAAEVLDEHWRTFITEDDFKYLSEHGVDYVRIPIPWWLWGETFTYTHEDVTHTVTYLSALPYVEQAMVWAELYNIEVLLDLHTAPGCQNGFDNGGISGVLQWESEENVDKTLAVIEKVAEHFSSYDSLWGIEVLNEPGWSVDMDILQGYYLDAYVKIRKHNPTVWVGFHDGFRMYLTETWRHFFVSNSFTNVFFDIHLYQTFGDHWSDYTIDDHLEWVEVEQYKAVHRYDGIVPTVVGEWSLGLQGNVYEDLNNDGVYQLKQAYANKQLNVYENAFGWFFWNYKIDQGTHMEWDMVRLIESGIFPESFETMEEN